MTLNQDQRQKDIKIEGSFKSVIIYRVYPRSAFHVCHQFEILAYKSTVLGFRLSFLCFQVGKKKVLIDACACKIERLLFTLELNSPNVAFNSLLKSGTNFSVQTLCRLKIFTVVDEFSLISSTRSTGLH
jgi:hypothetical protein